MKRLFSILIFIQFIRCAEAYGQDEPLSGLYFASHEVYQDKRTSLCLSPAGPFRFPDGFSLEFDINFRPGDGYYGYIFRIIGNRDTNIDLVANLAADTANIWLVYGEKVLLSLRRSELPTVDYGRWARIRIDIDVRAARIVLDIDGRRRETVAGELRALKLFDVFFGACRLNVMHNTDVCPMSVKNVCLYTAGGDRLFRRWELRRHAVDRVYDETVRAEAAVENPVWLIDRYTHWRKLADLHVDCLRGITADSAAERIFFVSDRAVYSLSPASLAIDTFASRGGSPHPVISGQNIIYNRYTDEIWSYDFASPVLSRFRFSSRTWSHSPTVARETEYAHHNALVSPADSSLVALFGYGFYTYKDAIHIYNTRENAWRDVADGIRISPRYLSSAGLMNSSQALVFGGYGSRSGRQELSPGAYYDLHLFDFRDCSFTHLWTLPPQSKPFVPSRTLVFDRQRNRFYALTYNNGAYDVSFQLAEISVNRPEISFAGDAIPFRFLDTETWVYLFLCAGRSELIAVTSHNGDISLHAIAYRPLAGESVLQPAPPRRRVGARLWMVAAALLPVAGLLLLSARRRRRRRRREMDEARSVDTPFPASDRVQASAVYLMGGFQVFDMKGANVTACFSPTLKQLFLFVFFNSLMKGRGVTSEKIDEVLWPDRVGDSARNNRNVNVSRLRSVFELVGDIEIAGKSGLWQIAVGRNVYCDYVEIASLLTRVKKDTRQMPPPITLFNLFASRYRKALLTEKDARRLLELLGSGELLPDMQTAWLGKFRTAFAREAVDALTTLLRCGTLYSLRLRYRIAEFLLSVDFLNEDAIRVKCAILDRTGRRSEAKSAYDAFVQDYEQFTGTEYPVPFRSAVRM
ncbi:MAG: hypothetical protein LBK07_01770 [Tannerella sp.]|jgi:DNA-binding SARP family transcriptional activator|nr:hypothetical protein [Tannerella sp.]